MCRWGDRASSNMQAGAPGLLVALEGTGSPLPADYKRVKCDNNKKCEHVHVNCTWCCIGSSSLYIMFSSPDGALSSLKASSGLL